MPFIALLWFLLAALSPPVFADQRPQLTVYTYDSFVSEGGPGPAIKRAFEAECGCTLDLVGVDNAGSLLARLELEGAGSRADVVLGLDNSQRAQARASGLLAPLPADLPAPALPLEWHDDTFMPLDWGWFAFVYDRDRLGAPPTSFAELLNGYYRLVIQDPRTSTPGLGLLLWLRAVYGDEAAAAWQKLRPQIVTVTRGWSEAYGLFLRGEADMVLSYSSSPAYHLVEQHDARYAAALFDDRHYLQVELAARLSHARDPELAERFLRFLASAEVQRALVTGNWMYPAYASGEPLPQPFAELPRPTHSLMLDADQIAAHRRAWVREWQNALSR